jgi:hypothetical protein
MDALRLNEVPRRKLAHQPCVGEGGLNVGSKWINKVVVAAIVVAVIVLVARQIAGAPPVVPWHTLVSRDNGGAMPWSLTRYRLCLEILSASCVGRVAGILLVSQDARACNETQVANAT